MISTEPLEQRALLTASINGGALVVVGTSGPDTIVVTRSNGRFFVQENGEETVLSTGNVFNVRIDGREGGDTIDVRDLGLVVRIDGGPGADLIRGGNGRNDLRGGAGDDSIFGGPAADALTGGSGDDFIRGRGGRDDLSGGNGSDTLEGSGGADRIRGGSGTDVLRGNSDDDTLTGNGGDDVLLGAAGADDLRGGDGNDSILGEAGADTIQGDRGGDTLTGGSGNDLVLGEGGRDEISGGSGRDILIGGGGQDSLTGGDGDDILVAGTRLLSVNELNLVAAEWASANDYDQRVANIRNGSGANNERLNDREFLAGRERNTQTTVFNDFGQVDLLMGEAGEDWFFLARGFGDDDVDDRVFGERFERI
jgi:Ca2+-binding RTX toxin-like protein